MVLQLNESGIKFDTQTNLVLHQIVSLYSQMKN